MCIRDSTTDVRFRTTTGAERMRIDSTGNVGIGQTNPGQKLDVVGTIQSSVGLRVAGHPVVGYSSITGGYAANLGSTGSSTLNETHFYAGGTKRIAMTSTGTVFGDASQTADGMTATPNDLNQAEMGPGYLRLKRDDNVNAQQLTFDKNGSVHSYLETATSGLIYVVNGSGTTHQFNAPVRQTGAPGFKVYDLGFTKGTGWEHIGPNIVTVDFNNNSSGWLSSNGRFTPTRAGYYLFSFGGWANASTNGARYATSFAKNNARTYISGGDYCTVDSPLNGHSEVIYMNGSTDYVQLWGYSAISCTWGTTSHAAWWSAMWLH